MGFLVSAGVYIDAADAVARPAASPRRALEPGDAATRLPPVTGGPTAPSNFLFLPDRPAIVRPPCPGRVLGTDLRQFPDTEDVNQMLAWLGPQVGPVRLGRTGRVENGQGPLLAPGTSIDRVDMPWAAPAAVRPVPAPWPGRRAWTGDLPGLQLEPATQLAALFVPTTQPRPSRGKAGAQESGPAVLATIVAPPEGPMFAAWVAPVVRPPRSGVSGAWVPALQSATAGGAASPTGPPATDSATMTWFVPPAMPRRNTPVPGRWVAGDFVFAGQAFSVIVSGPFYVVAGQAVAAGGAWQGDVVME
ncbi:MAG: hypothetical protein K2R98_08540 [Gemmataceae bacterium]|nr:hypothetical protein [Gemmataceae bacterium]